MVDAQADGNVVDFAAAVVHDRGLVVVSSAPVSGSDTRRLLQATRGALSIEAELVPGWRLYDIHPHEERTSIRFELTDETDRSLDIEVHVDGERPVAEWRKTSADAQAAWAAKRAIEAVLNEVPTAELRSSVHAKAVESSAVVVREVEVRDDPLLARDFLGYRIFYGYRPSRVRVSAGAWEAPGDSARYAEPTNGRPYVGALYPYGKRFLMRRRFREYLARLGYALDANGYAWTVPLPETLRTAVRAMLGHAPAWLPHIEPLDLRYAGDRAWAERAAHGVLPTMVPPIPLVRLYSLRPPPHTVTPRIAPGMLVHDMSLHAFALHRVRLETLERLASTTASKAKGLKARLRHRARSALWLERTLTREAWQVWSQVERPEEFDAIFEKKLPTLARNFAEDVLGEA